MQRGVCPVCNGTCKVGDRPCNNCGNQYMYGSPKGNVRLNKDGQPCKHKYTGETVGRCLTEYTCEHCGDRYQIDSGD